MQHWCHEILSLIESNQRVVKAEFCTEVPAYAARLWKGVQSWSWPQKVSIMEDEFDDKTLIDESWAE